MTETILTTVTVLILRLYLSEEPKQAINQHQPAASATASNGTVTTMTPKHPLQIRWIIRLHVYRAN